MSIVALSGHRQERLGDIERLKSWTKFYLGVSKASAVICGMANGFDLIGGKVALDLGIPLICAKPWTTHNARREDEELYAELMDRAEEVYIVTETETYPGPKVYQDRNIWMCNEADKLLVAWDGTKKGGTWNMLTYAAGKKPAIIINPIDFSIRMRG